MSEYELNARRLLCPLPVIRTQNKIKELKTGDILTVICTDPGALNDVPAWCRINQHEILHSESSDGEIFIRIKVC
ncbi:MAG TPA: sulfurtransferase TusA family protein [Pseudomonadales bacterium]|jgi:tRNA 2-thiouridine synthesizing protein A|nr:SirA family protein [Gammaproteobacteria bacterium]MDP6027982.1 sulfurtransferase TusA family protein [Pseudomonadales bacterium]MDP6315817.1 sulfurtransferase TusA family protein [Pseudomonadales bacterium]MDP7315814.1 sulfurtransferase TusA family protein [Pseudomonadales bacterium]MDP7575529.1 sulfurtransferase TusA family protein [Pseudomonadales bacterium]|tara:strand:+ start:1020 stop:1244 length:225 start_codon:yes stop_codon:yes gene_type:complete